MPKSNRKGRRGELQLADRLGGKRVSKIGQEGPDVRDRHGRYWEAKWEKKLPQWLLRRLSQARREGAHALAVRQNYDDWIVIMDMQTFLEVYYEKEGGSK